MSVLTSLLRPLGFKQDEHWGETDLLWDGCQWILCHDFNEKKKIPIYNTAYSLFQNIAHIKNEKWRLILDIKWDLIHNQAHNFHEAIANLASILPETIPQSSRVYLQFSFPWQIAIAQHRATIKNYPIGLLLDSPCDPVLTNIDFVNINLHKIDPHEIKSIKTRMPTVIIFGFTCYSKTHLKLYKHLYEYLDGLVCEL